MLEALGVYLYWIIGAMVPVILLFTWKYIYDFHWFDYWFTHRFLFIFKSKMAELSENTGGKKGQSWCDAEEQLCDAYSEYITYPSQEEFNKNFAYLHKAGDAGRRPTPKAVWVFLISLVVAEGLGFSFLLGTVMTNGEASETMGTYLMWAIVFVLSGILVILTDFAGHQLYRTNLIKQCSKKRGEKRGDGNSISSQSIDKNDDDGQPSYVQTLNRMSNYQSANYSFLIAAGLLIVLIAIGSTYLRFYHHENSVTSETVGAVVANQAADIPPELGGVQKSADDQASAELKTGQSIEFGVGFVLLAVIFVFTQLVAIIMGYKYGFAGEFSKDSFKITRGFSSYDAMVFYYKPRIQIAQSRLKTLQNSLARRFEDHDFPLDMTFLELVARNDKKRSESKPREVKPLSDNQVYSENVAAGSGGGNEPLSAQAEFNKFCGECGKPVISSAKFSACCGFKMV